MKTDRLKELVEISRYHNGYGRAFEKFCVSWSEAYVLLVTGFEDIYNREKQLREKTRNNQEREELKLRARTIVDMAIQRFSKHSPDRDHHELNDISSKACRATFYGKITSDIPSAARQLMRSEAEDEMESWVDLLHDMDEDEKRQIILHIRMQAFRMEDRPHSRAFQLEYALLHREEIVSLN